MSGPVVVAVAASPRHGFHKQPLPRIDLMAGFGVIGDAHAGVNVQHRSRVARDRMQPNLRQLHLIHAELFDELARAGFAVRPAELGENVTTRGLDLLALPRGTRLRLGPAVEIELTGLRNPCVQIDGFQPGLTRAVLDRDAAGNLVRKAGVMAIVLTDGPVHPGDTIAVTLPDFPHTPLLPV
ncbi:MOSC domain-containing protein [Zavarzinia aquatilis]|uniref:MOSC domain-containing protein n=1 Tax=Zavarzinia aquatilis TaxID=2211142 RepID=A0A317EGI7_9PROT|nr:MOSC domain-containing protein [Zavarzinia aquatilis]PWR25406.1 MOSC domain-containing protein [Zavarzinia aquatilis]